MINLDEDAFNEWRHSEMTELFFTALQKFSQDTKIELLSHFWAECGIENAQEFAVAKLRAETIEETIKELKDADYEQFVSYLQN